MSNELTLSLDKNKKYILTCSYGPDSMALFDLLINGGYDFVVAHVNYHILTNANEDEANLREWCKKYDVPIYVLDKAYDHSMGNEEDVCRKIRYDFFKNLAKNLNIPNILIAHNLNDLVETYILQKERNNYVSYYGLSPSYTLGDVNFIRPLLKYPKKSLQEYCDLHNVPYSIDYTNFDEKYRRNYVRHEIVNKMSKEEIESYLEVINKENKEKEEMEKRLSSYIDDIFIDFKKVKDLSIEEKQCLIYLYMKEHKMFEPVSKGFIEDFFNQCLYHKGTFSLALKDICFECSYGKIAIYKYAFKGYEYKVIDGCPEKGSPFTLNKNSDLFVLKSLQNMNIIKNVSSDDAYLIDGHKKKVSRLFIDWKMPLILRKCWPGIYNGDGKLIYIPRYREDYKLTENSLLIFNSTKLIKESFFL